MHLAKGSVLGHTRGFKSNHAISKLIRIFMGLPILHAPQISQTLNLLATPCLNSGEELLLGKLKNA